MGSRQGSWDIGPFMRCKFYEYCSVHGKLLNMYCKTCNDDTPCCYYCSKHGDHKHHDVLQIRIDTGHATIHTNDVPKYIPTTDMHVFSINNLPVHFIQKREPMRTYKNKKDHYCKENNCWWPLKEENKYCSIYCKLKSMNHPAVAVESIGTLFRLAGRNHSDISNDGGCDDSIHSNSPKPLLSPPPPPCTYNRATKPRSNPKRKCSEPVKKLAPPSKSNIHTKRETKCTKLSITLSRKEIEVDIYAMTRRKPSSMTKKRPR